MTSSMITNAQRWRRLPWWYAANMLENLRFALTFGSVMVLFFDMLGLDKTRIGVLLSLLLFLQVLTPLVVRLVEWVGYKQTYIIFFGIRSLSLTGLLAAPLIFRQIGASGGFAWVLAIMLVYSTSQAIGMAAYGPWTQEIIPPVKRGKVTALNIFLCGLMIVFGTYFAGFWIGRFNGIGAFLTLIALAVVVGLASVACYLQVPGGAQPAKSARTAPKWSDMWAALTDKNFFILTTAQSALMFVTFGMASFLQLYQRDYIGIREAQTVYVSMCGWIGILLSVNFWGWAADRFGGKAVLLCGFLGYSILALLWLITPRGFGDVSFYFAAAFQIIGGLLVIANNVGVDRYLFLKAMPEDKRTSYYAVWSATTGLASGLGPVVFGLLLDWIKPLDNIGRVLKIIPFDSFTPLLAFHVVLPVLAAYWIGRTRADSETSATQFVGELVQELPFGLFGALGSVLRFQRGGDERQRIRATRQIGRFDSLFNTDELLEALNDPSFDVRFEAVLAMAERRQHPKITAALISVLEGEDIELAATAVWALGQIGDKTAIPVLRKMLSAPYRVLRARSARALAHIGDKDCAPMLLEMLQKEQDLFLKVAFSSALGALGYAPATEVILRLLAEVESPAFRGEVALAVARLVGNEKGYIQLYRQADEDVATALSEAILNLKRPMRRLGISSVLIDSLDPCADAFSAGHHGLGVELLAPILEALPKDQIDQAYRRIYEECTYRINQFGFRRPEYLLLALHTCAVWLRAKCALKIKTSGSWFDRLGG